MVRATPAHMALLACEDSANNLNYSLLAVRHMVEEYITAAAIPDKSDAAGMYAYALVALLDCADREFKAVRDNLEIISDTLFMDVLPGD